MGYFGTPIRSSLPATSSSTAFVSGSVVTTEVQRVVNRVGDTATGVVFGFLLFGLVASTVTPYAVQDASVPLSQTTLPPAAPAVLWLLSFVVYMTIDTVWQIAIELRTSKFLLEVAGYEQETQRLYLLPAWGLLAAFANTWLALLPALHGGMYAAHVATANGAVLGITSYATLSLPTAWTQPRFPLSCAVLYIFSGGLFHTLTALVMGHVAREMYGLS